MKFSLSKFRSRRYLLTVLVVAGVSSGVGVWAAAKDKTPAGPEADAPAAVKPALTVTLAVPQREQWPRTIVANGNIAAWQDVVIGSELNGFRLTEVLVNVGDVVRRNQLLARVSSATVAAELAQSKAALVEAEAVLAEAGANADRARQMQSSGALSAQQINQYLTAEQTELARVNAARARVQADELRLSQTRVLAPDDGVIAARGATVGSLTQPGQELFHLIRGNRLEWRAEVTATELGQLKAGMPAAVMLPEGDRIAGKVRMLAPTVDAQTRNAVVYVDLPAETAARAGMFARGEFELARTPVLTVPQAAVLVRDGFSYVYRLDKENRAVQVKVGTGRRQGERIEIVDGIAAETPVIASGAGFLTDGDVVRVVEVADAAAAVGTR